MSRKIEIDYDNEEEMDWMNYIHHNLSSDQREVPFKDSSISELRRESPFEKEDALKRSDEKLREIVLDELYNHFEIDASKIRIEVLSGHVAMDGFVSSEKQKNQAENLVKNIRGVWKLENHLEIILS